MQTQTKRYKLAPHDIDKGRQLSGLFNIISSNLLLATEVLSPEYKIKAVSELESLSRKARILAKELLLNSSNLGKDDLRERISQLKQRMVSIVVNILETLNKFDSNKSTNQKTAEDIILVKRLLRYSQRGLATIQD